MRQHTSCKCCCRCWPIGRYRRRCSLRLDLPRDSSNPRGGLLFIDDSTRTLVPATHDLFRQLRTSDEGCWSDRSLEKLTIHSFMFTTHQHAQTKLEGGREGQHLAHIHNTPTRITRTQVREGQHLAHHSYEYKMNTIFTPRELELENCECVPRSREGGCWGSERFLVCLVS